MADKEATPAISVISTKGMDMASPEGSKPGLYVNQAFDGDSEAKPASSPAPAHNGLYDDLSQAKRHHHGSVDFTMPERRRDSRLKSISDGPYRGMGKEELLRYSSQPLWRNLRYACISVVLAGWLALLITVVALILTYPQCRDSQSTAWWQRAVIYRVYVNSFLDAEGNDGVGDIRGIREKLDYIQSTGADTISLSPIYKLSEGSAFHDDVIDHKAIDPVFGTLNDFKLLVNETHERGMYLTVDFIPNHTSDQHPWFLQSSADTDDRENDYRSYYVWSDGPGLVNNWKSVYGCSAWEEYNNTRTFYLHQYTAAQPDLNLRSDKVKDELVDILEFWLDKGVDGFYIRDVDFLFEDYDMRDEPLLDNTTAKSHDCASGFEYQYSDFDHIYTKGLTQNMDMLARWRYLLDDYGNRTNRYRIMFADATGSIDHVMETYGLFNRDGVDFPLNPFTHALNQSSGGKAVGKLVSDWMDKMPAGRWANWMSGDDRETRLVDRLGEQLSKTYLMLMMLLPGTPLIYYGDEIGLASSSLPANNAPWSRQQAMRGPMLWNNGSKHGFCKIHCTQPWMGFAPAGAVRTDAEARQNDYSSIWHLLKNLTELRRDNPSFEYGDFSPALEDEHVYSFVREFDGEKGYLVALNFSPDETYRTYSGSHDTVPSSATVELVSGVHSGHARGGGVSLDPLSLAGREGIVVSWDYEAEL